MPLGVYNYTCTYVRLCVFECVCVWCVYYCPFPPGPPQGTDTPTLRLSKLAVGVYLFTLTVTDSAGQTDSSEVTVAVLSGECVSVCVCDQCV